jgi:hypothetical protein
MDFIEKAKIRLEHWLTHNDHHHEEYELFADQLEENGKAGAAREIREMAELASRSNECLRNALKELS